MTEQLNDLAALCATYPDDMAVEITHLRAQRDQLLAALKEIEALRPYIGPRAANIARATIAAVEDHHD
jgi:hypothetical protein